LFSTTPLPWLALHGAHLREHAVDEGTQLPALVAAELAPPLVDDVLQHRVPEVPRLQGLPPPGPGRYISIAISTACIWTRR